MGKKSRRNKAPRDRRGEARARVQDNPRAQYLKERFRSPESYNLDEESERRLVTVSAMADINSTGLGPDSTEEEEDA